MRKLLLFALLAPATLWAQRPAQLPVQGNEAKVAQQARPALSKDAPVSPVRIVAPTTPAGGSAAAASIEFGEVDTLGLTYYDLMTNGATPDRLVVYPDGRVSAVFPFSLQPSGGFPDRGTNYVHYNGSSWTSALQTRLEKTRSGWPEIMSVGTGTQAREYIVSHFASLTTDFDGGIYMMHNDAVGSTNFTVDSIDVPYGPLWPRAAALGDYIHIVAAYNDDTVVRNGVRRPIVYYRYNWVTDTWVDQDITLPGYDSVRYAVGSIDDYSIHARGSTIAIVMGGTTQDLTMWKSTDNGDSWTTTIIDSFDVGPWDPWQDTPFFDTIWVNDGSINVTLDDNGDAHVFWGLTRVLNTNPDGIDTSWSYFPGIDGIVYWNENDQQQLVIGQRPLYYGGQGLDQIYQGTYLSQEGVLQGGAYFNGLSTFPSAAIDNSGNLYCVYSAVIGPDYTVQNGVEQNFRDVFVTYSSNGGQSWSQPQNLIQNMQMEDVFPTVARSMADGNLHVMWMQDEFPGTNLQNEDPVTLNRIMYARVPTAPILANELGSGWRYTTIENGKTVTIDSKVYPNPAQNIVMLSLNAQAAAQVNVKVLDMTGKETGINLQQRVVAGNNTLALNLSDLPKGIYTCQVIINGQVANHKVVKN